MKRLLDIFVSALALLIFFPLLVALVAAIRMKLGSPAIFIQQRPGLHGRPFAMYKLRTMSDVRNDAGALLPDVARLSSFGRALRSSSVDELPGLWNVLRGDMSLVGPRPLLMEYLPLYTAAQARRHDVRPGITGWAQVNGRNALSWEEKFALDVWYVEHHSLWLDLTIVWKTLAQVVGRHGVSSPGEATMSKFTGSPS